MMLIADERKLLKLTLALGVDVEYLINSIRSQPTKLDETARSSFLEGLFSFIREAINLTPHDIENLFARSKNVSNVLPPAGSILTPATTPSVCSFSGASPYTRGYPLATELPDLFPAASTATSAASLSISLPTVMYPSPLSQLHVPAAPVIPSAPNSGAASLSGRRGIWFPNAPGSATPSNLAAQICGGPLVSLEAFPHDYDTGKSFMINFIDPDAAAAYLDFCQTPMGQLHFPNTHGNLQFYLRWSDNDYQINPKVFLASNNPVNPARRALAFSGYPGMAVDEEEFMKRFRTLEKKGRHGFQFSIESFEISKDRSKALLVCSKLPGAIVVRGWHRAGLFGVEFNHCNLIYGRDPTDRPIPVAADTAELISSEPVTSLPTVLGSPNTVQLDFANNRDLPSSDLPPATSALVSPRSLTPEPPQNECPHSRIIAPDSTRIYDFAERLLGLSE